MTEFSEPPLRVSTLELFFDLVFVFTITQLTGMLADDLTPRGALRVLLVFGVLWWMYGGYAWLTNARTRTRCQNGCCCSSWPSASRSPTSASGRPSTRSRPR